MAITYQELEAAGYVIHKEGYITKDGVRPKQYVIKGRVNVEVYLPRQEGKSKPWTYVRLHRMIAEKYVPNPEGLHYVAFKRGKSCRWSNLTWSAPQAAHSTTAAAKRRHGIILLELGEIGWREAAKTYEVNPTIAYNIWRKNNATLN